MGAEMNKSMDLITELCVYFECEASEIQDRLQNGTLRSAEEWQKMDPKTPEETMTFYREAKNYVFDLAQWHLSEWTKRQTQNIVEFCYQKGLCRILDYGCGIGEEGIALAESGVDVTLADVPGNTFNFAKWRVKQRGLQVKFINIIDNAPLQETYDEIICLEVLEHLWEPEAIVKHLHQHLASEGFLLVTATFYHSDLHPMHLKKNLKYQGEGFLQMMRNIGFESFGRGYQPMIFQKRQICGLRNLHPKKQKTVGIMGEGIDTGKGRIGRNGRNNFPLSILSIPSFHFLTLLPLPFMWMP